MSVGRSLPGRAVSIHAPRGRSDSFQTFIIQQICRFNPRSPWEERLLSNIHYTTNLSFQSTLPVGGATDSLVHFVHFAGVSIHAPRGRSDASVLAYRAVVDCFNPRSPWEERHGAPPDGANNTLFQSTLPVGGATTDTLDGRQPFAAFQSTLPVGGATLPP